MMKKARKGFFVESSSSSSLPSVGQDARMSFKHHALLQDYEELLRETEAKKRQLQQTIVKKVNLTAEVKFLRRKLESFSRNPSQTVLHKLKKKKKKPSVKMASPPTRFAPPKNVVNSNDFAFKHRNQRAKDGDTPSTSLLFDLNQVSEPHADEMEGIQVEWEPLQVDKLKRCSVDGNVVGSGDLNLRISRDVGNSSNHVAKRKLSWQDQVALRV